MVRAGPLLRRLPDRRLQLRRRPLRGHRPAEGAALPGGSRRAWSPIPTIGSYLGLYYVLDGHHDEWNRWAVDQVNVLHAAGRMFTDRDHIHTGLYHFEWEHRRDEDGVPAELTLDHRFPGMVSVFIEPAEGVAPEQIGAWYRERVPALGAARVGGGHRAGLQPAAPAGRRPRRRPPLRGGGPAAAAAVLPRRRRRPARGTRSSPTRPTPWPGRDSAGCSGPRRSSAPSPAPTPTPTSCGRHRPDGGLHRRPRPADRRPGLGRAPTACGG